jgi:hypothetical protein
VGSDLSPLLDVILDFDNMMQEEEQKLYFDFQKAQYSLLHVLSENFGTHEKQIIAGWTPTHWMVPWLPFGYMCLRSIDAKYDDSGVTDAITKYNAYVTSKTFTPSNITKLVSTIEHAWAGWRNTVTDPEHMAAVELVREILSSDNEDLENMGFLLCHHTGDKPYMVADLLEKVVDQDKLLNAGGRKRRPQLYSPVTVSITDLLNSKELNGISRPTFKPKNIKKGKQKKRCATKDCKNVVRVHFHKFCDDCYSSRREKSSAENESAALDDVPASVREQNHNRLSKRKWLK